MRARTATILGAGLVAVLLLAGGFWAGVQRAATGTGCVVEANVFDCALPAAVTPAGTPAQPTITTVPAGSCTGAPNDAGGPDPWGGCWPGPDNTGVRPGTALSVVNGDQTLRTEGETIEGKDIRGCVSVTAPNVTIRNSRISCDGFAVVNYGGSSGRLTLEDVTLQCTGNGGTAVGERSVTVTRANISGCENGFATDTDATIRDTYVHDLYQGESAHTDGLQSGVGTNLLLEHNTIFANNGTSAVIINMNQPGCCVDTTITRNLVAGGAYTIYCPKSATVNYQVTDNVFLPKFYPTVGDFGPVTDCAGEIFTGNIYADGSPVQVG